MFKHMGFEQFISWGLRAARLLQDLSPSDCFLVGLAANGLGAAGPNLTAWVIAWMVTRLNLSLYSIPEVLERVEGLHHGLHLPTLAITFNYQRWVNVGF